MTDFTPYTALIGGALIGLGAALFLLAHGRVAGISGLFGAVLRREPEALEARLSFIGGLLLGGVLLRFAYPEAFAASWRPPLAIALAAGMLVGVGTQLGNGCTSGHGICGLSRLSVRSAVATGTFMAAGFGMVLVVRHLFGHIR